MPAALSNVVLAVNADVDSGAAEQITATSTKVGTCPKVKAFTTNTNVIYVGLAGVTTTTGYPLSAGQEVDWPVDDLSKIYVIAAADNQAVAVMAGL